MVAALRQLWATMHWWVSGHLFPGSEVQWIFSGISVPGLSFPSDRSALQRSAARTDEAQHQPCCKVGWETNKVAPFSPFHFPI
jgi:hypothetical protein